MSDRYPRTAEEGTYKTQCSRCGQSVKHYQLLREPNTNLRVCDSCWDELHPQYFVRQPKPDSESIPFSRPQGVIRFGAATCSSNSAIPGDAIPGCMWPAVEGTYRGASIRDSSVPKIGETTVEVVTLG
jgi:hypothetical protein